MKFKRAEIIWLIAGILAYLFFNIPGVPAYNDFMGSIIHNCVGFALIWIVSYIGFFKVNKIYRARKKPEDETSDEKSDEKQ